MEASNYSPNKTEFPEFKGLFYQNDIEEDLFYEFKAHFSYLELYNRLEHLKKYQNSIHKESTPSPKRITQLGLMTQSITISNKANESRNKKPTAPYNNTTGKQLKEYTKERNQSVKQKTSLMRKGCRINTAYRNKKLTQVTDVKNMAFKHIIRPTHITVNNNKTNKETICKTRNILQSIKLIKDYTTQDIAGKFEQKSRNRSRNNKELESKVLFSQGQGGAFVHHSSNEIKRNNGSNNNTVLASHNNKQGATLPNKKSRNIEKRQLCLSNENKSGGTNKTVQNQINHNNTSNLINKIQSASYTTQKNYKSLLEKNKTNLNMNINTITTTTTKGKKHIKDYSRPKVVTISTFKSTTTATKPINQNTYDTSAIANKNNHFDDISKKKSNQNSFIFGRNLTMKKYHKEIASKTFKHLILTNNSNNQGIKKDKSITKENKNNTSFSLSQEKFKKTKSICSNTNTNSILYNSSISKSILINCLF